jgi:hypothetical protein
LDNRRSKLVNLILICLLGLGEAAATVAAFWVVMRVLGGRRRSLSDRTDKTLPT